MKKTQLPRPKPLLGLVLLLACGLAAWAGPLMPGSQEVRLARGIFSQAGRVLALDAYPVSSDALATALENLALVLDGRDKALAGRARELAARLRPQGESLVLGSELDLVYAHRLRSDEVLLERGPARDGIDFYRSYLAVPPLAVLNLSLGGSRGLSIEAEAEMRREWREGWFADSNLMDLGVDQNPLAFENNNISRGLLRWQGEAGRVSLGRDRVHYGPLAGGTLYPSSRLPYWDSLRADLALGRLRLNWYVGTIQARRSRSGSTADVDPGPGFGFETDTGTTVILEDDTELVFPGTPSVILSAMHRFSWDFGRLQVGIAGLQLVSRPNNYIHIADFFPVFSWHNADVRQNNMMLLADLAWVPLPGLVLSAVAGVDDVNAEAVGVADRSGIPTIYAWVLGAEYQSPVLEGRSLLSAELGYTHYLWGNYDGSVTMGLDPNPLSRAVFRYLRDGGSVLMPLTSPYGPGAAWLSLEASHQLAQSPLSFSLEATLLSKNTQATLVGTPYEEDRAVAEADRVLFGSLGLKAGYRKGSLGLGFTPRLLYQDGSWWAELDLLASWKLGGKVSIND